MPRINWNDPDDRPRPRSMNKYKAGDVVEVRIAKSEERTSKKGHAYFNVELRDDKGDVVCFDTIMLEGKGRGIGTSKLRALGYDETCQELLAADLVGKTVWVYLTEEEWQGDKQIKVALHSEDDWRCGYYNGWDTPPEADEKAMEDPYAVGDGDDRTPF